MRFTNLERSLDDPDCWVKNQKKMGWGVIKTPPAGIRTQPCSRARNQGVFVVGMGSEIPSESNFCGVVFWGGYVWAIR